MKKLVNDVFGNGLNEALIKEYYERNERKKQDEAWLKKNSQIIKKALEELGKRKTVIGNIRVAVSIPDTSHFDMEKVHNYLLSDRVSASIYQQVIKKVVDEEKLTNAIEDGSINFEELKTYAWIESTGTPRLTIKKVGE